MKFLLTYFFAYRISVNEKYLLENARQPRPPPSVEELKKAFENAKENTLIKKILNPLLGIALYFCNFIVS